MKPLHWTLFSAAGLVTGGPVGALLSPLAYRWTGQKLWAWALLGVVGAPLSWVPIAAFLPEPAPSPEVVEAPEPAKEPGWLERAAAEREAEADRREQERQAREQERAGQELARQRKELEKWASIGAFVGCSSELKSMLNDPDSYRPDRGSVRRVIDYDTQDVTLYWAFRAKNEFGGYVQARAACETSPDSYGLKGTGVPSVAVVE